MSDHPVASRKHGNERVHVHSKRGFRGQPGHVTRGYEHLLYLMVYLSEEIDFLLLGLLLAGKRTIANWKNLGVDGRVHGLRSLILLIIIIIRMFVFTIYLYTIIINNYDP